MCSMYVHFFWVLNRSKVQEILYDNLVFYDVDIFNIHINNKFVV